MAVVETDLAAAKLDRDGWALAPTLVEAFDLAEQRKTLADALSAAEADAAPLAARRVETAAAYAVALNTLATTAAEQMAAADVVAEAAAKTGSDARLAHGRAQTALAGHEAAGRTARLAVERFDADVAAFTAEAVLESGEAAAAAAERHAATDAAAAARAGEVRATIEETKAAVARDRARRDGLAPAVERARIETETAAKVRDDLIARRDALSQDPRMAIYLPDDDADIIGMGRTIGDAISEAVRRADAGLIDLALDGADDTRALAGIDATGLLPAAPDLARAKAILDDAHISAVSGWTYLAGRGRAGRATPGRLPGRTRSGLGYARPEPGRPRARSRAARRRWSPADVARCRRHDRRPSRRCRVGRARSVRGPAQQRPVRHQPGG